MVLLFETYYSLSRLDFAGSGSPGSPRYRRRAIFQGRLSAWRGNFADLSSGDLPGDLAPSEMARIIMFKQWGIARSKNPPAFQVSASRVQVGGTKTKLPSLP